MTHAKKILLLIIAYSCISLFGNCAFSQVSKVDDISSELIGLAKSNLSSYSKFCNTDFSLRISIEKINYIILHSLDEEKQNGYIIFYRKFENDNKKTFESLSPENRKGFCDGLAILISVTTSSFLSVIKSQKKLLDQM